MHLWTIISFLGFTGLVAAVTVLLTRRDDHATGEGWFLAGRRLTAPFIAGSLLLTNLSTEQMVGLNGAAFADGLAQMVWEVVAVIALVAMALFFLPRFLRSGIATVPQFLEERFDGGTRAIADVVFLLAYAVILLPIVLYTGAMGLVGIMDVKGLLGIAAEQVSILGLEVDADTFVLWLAVWVVGLIGACYALFGGLRTVAVSDTLNGAGLLVGGLMITFFGLDAISRTLGDGTGIFNGWEVIRERAEPGKTLNSIGGADTKVPFGTVFTGILLLNLFYWCTNQQIIQRTFGASSLKEGQKGVLLCALLKLLGPLYLVLPGIMAWVLYAGDIGFKGDRAYGTLVADVLPPALSGFFAAVLVGAILSSFNSALNSTCTIFSIGIYGNFIQRGAGDREMVRAGKIAGWTIAVVAMLIAPWLARTASIFGYLQKMNGIYFIPIFAVVTVGMLTKRVVSAAARTALVGGLLILLAGYFVPIGRGERKVEEVVPAAQRVAALADGARLVELVTVEPLQVKTAFGAQRTAPAPVTYARLERKVEEWRFFAPGVMHEYHFLGAVFLLLVAFMLLHGRLRPRVEPWRHRDAGVVDLTPWKGAVPAAAVLVLLVLLIYAAFAG